MQQCLVCIIVHCKKNPNHWISNFELSSPIIQELARFDQPVSVTGSHDSSCSSSRSSLLDDLRSVQSSTRSSTIGSARESVRSGSVRSGSIRGSSVRSMYAYKGDALYKVSYVKNRKCAWNRLFFQRFLQQNIFMK